MKAIGYILLIFCIISLIFFVLSGINMASYPFGLDFGEGYLLEHARLTGEGKNIYADINSYPYTVCNYAPLYPFITGMIMKIGDISLAPGRWVAIIATLACCWLIGFIVLRLTRNQLLSLVCGMMFVCIPAVFRWGQVMRVDTLAVALSLAGLAVYFAAGDDKKKLWCIPFFIAAFLTKQSMLSAPVAVIIHYLMVNRRSGIRFLIITVVSGIAVYFLVDMITGFGMHKHTFLYTANSFFTERLWAGINIYASFTAPVILIALFYLFSGKGIFRDSPAPLYFILATGTLLTYGYVGSDSNYFIEPFAATLLMVGMGIHSYTPSESGKRSSTKWVGVFLMVLLLTQFVMIRLFQHDEFRVMHVDVNDAQQGELLVSLIRNTEGEVISEDASFQVLAGKPVVFEPYIMTLLAERGKWDESKFVEDLRNGKFELLILRFDVNNPNHTDRTDDFNLRIAGFNRFSDAMEDAIAEAYEIDKNLMIHSRRNWYIYRPVTKVD